MERPTKLLDWQNLNNKMAILPNAIYSFSVTPSNIPIILFTKQENNMGGHCRKRFS